MISTQWSPTPVHTPLTWAIWGVLTAIMSIVIVAGIVGSIYFYRKTKKPFLTINKIAMLAIYLTLFLLQAFLFAPLLNLPMPFSFDSIETIAVGFIFGPLEGILFGWVADSLRVLIHGWSYQILPSLMFPVIGLISGMAGVLWRRRENLNVNTMKIVFHSLILTLFVCIVPALFGLNYLWNDITHSGWGAGGFTKVPTMIVVACSVVICLALMEGMFFWFIKSNKENKGDLFLVILLFIAAIADRGMELAIRPFMQYFSGYEKVYVISLAQRMVSSTYLIPVVTITSFWLIKFSYLATDLK